MKQVSIAVQYMTTVCLPIKLYGALKCLVYAFCFSEKYVSRHSHNINRKFNDVE